MRIMVKGGVWKNTEDEILKAAVMKYGKNQWARISSLLVRKSAKQCKARWHEWLDPSIKKTEWSREEEEKLLHLAKIMPNQWKTIAPIVGRTASQCLVHYEKLLDAAQNKDAESYEPSDDPRRLRPGEIDPNPEAKAARPDPIDMDEDEKEMLSEARARLANTKGKKAKRKAREKQLEEARRLAALQKRRELKAAGIEVGRPKRRIKGIDYNREIPFQKKPPPGFYDVDFSHEKALANQPFRPLKLEDVDPKRKREMEEEEEQKEDNKKFKKKEKSNLPAVIMQINKLNDPDQIHTRTKLVLPSPQLSDKELEEAARLGVDATPLRTPARREDSLLKDAQDLIALTASQTPLLPSSSSSSFPATPLSTPARRRVEATPVRTAKREEAGKQLELRASLKSGLQSLPAPQNEYKIVLPELSSEEGTEESSRTDDDDDALDVDASDLLHKQQRLEQQREAERLRLRSQVLQRELPRPIGIETTFTEFKSKQQDSLLRQAEEMLRTELVSLISHEGLMYPFKQSRFFTNTKEEKEFDEFSESEIKVARGLVDTETSKMCPDGFPSLEEIEKVSAEVEELLITHSTKKERVESMLAEHETIKTMMGREATRAKKLESKLNVYNGGYQNRANSLLKSIQETFNDIDQAHTELLVFSKLREFESQAMLQRIEVLSEEVQAQEERERLNQQRYMNLITDKENLKIKS